MSRRIIRYSPPRWVVYGLRPHTGSAGRMSTAAVHQENIETEAEAIGIATGIIMIHPLAQLVVVRLERGIDKNGERTVILRRNGGKAWWE